MVGALISWGNNMHAIKMVDPDKTRLSASFFVLYAQDYLPASKSSTCSYASEVEEEFNSYFICSCLLLFRVPWCSSLDDGSICYPRQEKRPSSLRTRTTCAFHLCPWPGNLLGYEHVFWCQSCRCHITKVCHAMACADTISNVAYKLKARDLGPRIALAMLGYSPSVIWNYRSQFWLWTGIIAPILGAISGGAFYDAFLYTGDDSIFSAM